MLCADVLGEVYVAAEQRTVLIQGYDSGQVERNAVGG